MFRYLIIKGISVLFIICVVRPCLGTKYITNFRFMYDYMS